MGLVRQTIEYARPLLRSTLLRNTSTLMIYVVAGYFITIAASPVLTRLYTPDAFGLYGTFLAFPTMCLVVAALNFDTVAPAIMDETEAANVAAGAVLIAIVMAIILTLVFLLFIIDNILGYGTLPAWGALAFFPVLLAWSLTSTAQYWCIRRQRFQSIGIGTAIASVVRAATQIVLSFTGLGWFAMTIGEFVGRASNATAYLYASREDVARLWSGITLRGILRGLWNERRFATVLLPPMAVDAVFGAVTLPVIGSLFGLATAGQYFLMKRILDLPASLMSRTAADAFYGRISDHAKDAPHRIRPLLVRTFCLIAATGAVGALPIILFGPTLCAVFFGAPWREAGIFAAVMAPALVVNLAAAPVARVFAVTRSPMLRYAYTSATVIGVTLTLAVAWTAHITPLQTVIGLSLTQFTANLVYFASAYVAAGRVGS